MRIIKYLGGGLSLPSNYVDHRKAWFGFLSGLSESPDENKTGTANNFLSDEKGAIGIFTKTMTDDVMLNVLPVDGRELIDMSIRFSDYINPFDPSSATSVYSSILQRLLLAKYEKGMYDAALTKARERGSLRGPAISDDGAVWVKNGNKVTKKSIDDIKRTDRLVTVSELAQIRAYNPKFAGDLSIIVAIDNSTSMGEILDYIKKVVGDKIDTNSTKNLAYLTKLLVEAIKGYEGILSASIDGVYKLSVEHMDNYEQADALLEYVYTTLESNLRAYLAVIAKKFGIHAVNKDTKEAIDPIKVLLMKFIQGKFTYTNNYEVNFEKDITAASLGYDIYGDKDGKSGSGKGLGEIESSPVTEFFLQRGEQLEVHMLYGRSHLVAIGTRGILEDSLGNPLGKFVDLNAVSSSGYARGMNTNQMYFGSTKVDNKSKNKVIVDGTSLINVALPIDLTSRDIKPNFKLFDDLTKAYNEVERLNAKGDPVKINAIFLKHGLPVIYNVGPNGEAILTTYYRLFAVMHGYADSSAIKSIDGEDLEHTPTILKPAKEELDNIVELIRGADEHNKKYKPTYDTWLSVLPFVGNPDIYEGSVFIPIYENAATYITNHQKTTLKQNELMNEAFYNLNRPSLAKNSYKLTAKISGLNK